MNEKNTNPRNWTKIAVIVLWLLNFAAGGLNMVAGNHKDAATFFLSSNIFVLYYANFFNETN